MRRKSSRQATLTPSSSGFSLQQTVPPSLLDPSYPLPKLIVFDLDYTLWPFWVDTHVVPPLKPNATHSAGTDRNGEDYSFYQDVSSILQALPQLPATTEDGNATTVKLGVASRTSAPQLARDLLKMLYLPPLAPPEEGEKPKKAVDVFDGGLEIYPSSKIKHFEALQKRTGLRFEDMLFFDDEARNRDTETLGVTMWLVRDGVTWDEIEKGVAEWRRRRGYRSG